MQSDVFPGGAREASVAARICGIELTVSGIFIDIIGNLGSVFRINEGDEDDYTEALSAVERPSELVST